MLCIFGILFGCVMCTYNNPKNIFLLKNNADLAIESQCRNNQR